MAADGQKQAPAVSWADVVLASNASEDSASEANDDASKGDAVHEQSVREMTPLAGDYLDHPSLGTWTIHRVEEDLLVIAQESGRTKTLRRSYLSLHYAGNRDRRRVFRAKPIGEKNAGSQQQERK